MLAEQYVEIFDELGIYDHRGAPNLGRTLKHPISDLPNLYFNRNGEVGVYFVGRVEDENYFPEHLWGRIPDNLVKARDRQIAYGLPIVPKAGRERQAFVSLIESVNTRY